VHGGVSIAPWPALHRAPLSSLPAARALGRLMMLQRDERTAQKVKKKKADGKVFGRNANQTNREDGSNLASVYRNSYRPSDHSSSTTKLFHNFSVRGHRLTLQNSTGR